MASGGEDEAWFDELYKQHRGELLTQALRLLYPRCRQDAEDAVDEAFTRVWLLRHRRPADAEPIRWLYGILRNCVREIRRRDGRSVVVLAEDMTPYTCGHDGGIGLAEHQEDLPPAWARLSPAQRDVLALHGEGLSSEEVAQILGIRPAAARKRLQRARDRLRALTEGNDGPPAPTQGKG